MTYWDTIPLDETVTLGSHLFTAEDIRRFAALYDPQPFHLDEGAAKASVLGGLCASGWHTACIFARLDAEASNARAKRWVAAGHAPPRTGPAPGFRNLKWPRPVYAGDTITYHQRIVAKRAGTNEPGWGLVESLNFAVNQDGTPVFEVALTGRVALE